MSSELDLLNRDPNGINPHLQCQFEDVLAEPEGTHTIDCVWKLSYTCFNLWKGCCYKLITVLCGICIASYWGCCFAGVSFNHIWYYTPCLKVLSIECGCARKCFTHIISCCIEPCCTAMGYFFHMFKK